MSLFTELKRRNVFRVAAAYLVTGWLLIEVGSTLEETLHLPDWTDTLLAFFLIIGFPIALFVSWAYEITPEGIKREKEVEIDASSRSATARKLNQLTVTVMALALAYFALDKWVFTGKAPASAQPAAVSALPQTTASRQRAADETPSVAVLPFVNMSADAENEYFSDGISEELLNVLVKVDGLRVPSRTSSFAFKGLNTDIKEIARQLDVGHVLEGSVRKAGNRVRVTAQLIDVATDTHLWSETYDRELEDIFAIQDEISGHIVDALKLALAPDAAPRAPTPSLEAYNLFLQGRHLAQKRGPGLRDAEALLKRAIALDPDFAEAWGALSLTYALFPYYLGMPAEEMAPRVMETANRALALDRDLADPSLVLAKEKMRTYDWLPAYSIYESVIAKHPGNSLARLWYGIDLLKAGYIAEAEGQLAAGVQVDPVSGINLDWHARALLMTGQEEAALSEARKALQLGRRQARFGVFMLALESGREHVVEEMGADLPPDFEEQYGQLLRLARNPSGKTALLEAAARMDSPDFPNAARYARLNVLYASHDPEGYAGAMQDVLSFDDSASTVVWFRGASWFRSSAPMQRLVAEMGLIELWRTRGWPDLCRPTTAKDFECD